MNDAFFHLAYLGPGGPEFMMVMLVLLVLFGAKDAPRILRKINEVINQIRNTADSFKREVMYGDIHSATRTPAASSMDEYDPEHDDDYSYGDDYDYSDPDEERDYSNDTFQSLEKDLEEAGPAEEERAPEPGEQPEVKEEKVEEDGHDRKD